MGHKNWYSEEEAALRVKKEMGPTKKDRGRKISLGRKEKRRQLKLCHAANDSTLSISLTRLTTNSIKLRLIF